ncbi:MAG TPA: 5'-3' exonuclease H3TH domain-containing protein, partial [Candidatus Saccharimonadales bacterium]|nr:5'-3' exonuclease H3TH domain-containing protein [Candidatus Saccharimonadales bacterium]
MTKRAKLVLIDGKAVFHRAYHAIPHLTNKDGLPTNAIYGFSSMLLKALGDLKPDYAILTWDKAKTSLSQRLEWYPEYKIKRLKMPEDFYAQIPLVRELAAALSLPMLELDHYEADDIIGTLVKRHPELEVVIVTNDRDVFQLLDGNVTVYTARKGMTDTVVYDAAKVQERYGIAPRQIIDLKALEGDSSDNIPGIAGVGEKTALDLIGRFGSLDGIYEHLDEVTGKLHDRLAEGKDIAHLSYKLATIMCDAPVELDLETARWGNYDKQAIHELFRRLDFKSLLRNLPAELDATPNLFNQSEPPPVKARGHIEKAHYRCVQTSQDLNELVRQLDSVSCFAFDTETDALDVMSANLVGLAISFKEGEAWYVPIGHQHRESGIVAGESGGADRTTNYEPQSPVQQLPAQTVIEALKPLLENAKIDKVGHNLKFDYQIMKRYGVTLAPISFDTMIAAFLLNPLGRAQTLGDLAYSELGIEMIPIQELIGQKGKLQTTFDRVSVEDATRYAAEDADISWRLYQVLKPQ